MAVRGGQKVGENLYQSPLGDYFEVVNRSINKVDTPSAVARLFNEAINWNPTAEERAQYEREAQQLFGPYFDRQTTRLQEDVTKGKARLTEDYNIEYAPSGFSVKEYNMLKDYLGSTEAQDLRKLDMDYANTIKKYEQLPMDVAGGFMAQRNVPLQAARKYGIEEIETGYDYRGGQADIGFERGKSQASRKKERGIEDLSSELGRGLEDIETERELANQGYSLERIGQERARRSQELNLRLLSSLQ